jgi:DNA-binding response OmpR family regulator
VASTKLRQMGYHNLIVGLTGNAFDDDRKAFIYAGTDLVLSKPLKADQLDALIKFIHATGAQSLFKRHMTILTGPNDVFEWGEGPK